MFAVGAVAADALPATASEAPAAPKTGNAFRRRFPFEACLLRAMADPFLCLRRDTRAADGNHSILPALRARARSEADSNRLQNFVRRRGCNRKSRAPDGLPSRGGCVRRLSLSAAETEIEVAVEDLERPRDRGAIKAGALYIVVIFLVSALKAIAALPYASTSTGRRNMGRGARLADHYSWAPVSWASRSTALSHRAGQVVKYSHTLPPA
jgi:hypothetical protein